MGQDTRDNAELDRKLRHYRLSRDEHRRIVGLIGREPQGVEWALFSALWSEHCSYKSSRVHLKGLFNQSPRVLQSFGENAGVVDLGEGERVAFKMESHNHPSFIEPYQGAATGVGGILRDIFTMGARPIALADYLCFGRPEAKRMEKLVDGVVRGIGGYGNCVGVPTITGQTEFDESYDKNILVNAMAVGLFRPGEKVFLSKASGVGNLVVYAGAKTGRDGVHGASMASESFDKESEKKRPTVQIGDPFFEKLLIESSLEVMEQDLVVAIQDMGAAGLTSSSFEMAAKGGVGFTLHLDRVPLRDATLEPEDILLSESQERMLMVVEPSKLERLQALYHRWGLDAVAIGEVTKDRVMRLYWKGDLLTSIDPDLLVEHPPRYERAYESWKPKHRITDGPVLMASGLKVGEELLKLLGSAEGASREFIYRQYDGHVGASTAADCRESVGVVRLKDSGRGLGVVLGCRPYLMRFDALEGGRDTVAYPSLELAAKGFEPLAMTDCLNFGNPERLEVMTSFVAALGGMNELARELVAPIISGNVSFYNETEGRNITPTPSTGLVGLRRSVEELPTSNFTQAGHEVFVVSTSKIFEFGGAFAEKTKLEPRAMGAIDRDSVKSLVTSLLAVEAGGFIQASRVVGKFGLGYALSRMALGGVGAEVNGHSFAELFSERLYEVVIATSLSREDFEKQWATASGGSAPIRYLGRTGGSILKIGSDVELTVQELTTVYHRGWVQSFPNLAVNV
ncbi:MAG: phosphoribosylformylglycinamidine synthase subunit PurL [Bdellovibrionales bacterium]|nr:phosphoribosylformylglycinamidine synthase subunit PurL [Bdellovibrionales bacterium]